MSIIARGHITDGMIKNGIENNRGMSCERQEDAVVDIRDLEARLRDAGCSRSEAKMYIARYKVIAALPDDQLRDAADYRNAYQRDVEPDTEPDAFSELMDRMEKLQIQ